MSDYNAPTVDKFANPTIVTLERMQSLAFKHGVVSPTTLAEVPRELGKLDAFTRDVSELLRGAYVDGVDDSARWVRRMTFLQLWRFYRNGKRYRR